ncbi:MAG: 3,8-cyclase MoaA [Pseudomonadota bacterium]|jgi:cyclic pyranopterin phosphate synthase
MSERVVIPLKDHRKQGWIKTPTGIVSPPNGRLVDARQRPLRDLRISVTDRCNFRCTYCMPREVFGPNHRFLPQSDLLSFEEIKRLAEVFVAHGVQKIRLTGGEPLLRKHIERLVEMLAGLRAPQDQALDLTLTTNASLLAQKAQALKDAGLQRISVSLDALDDAIFRRMNDADHPVASVLNGIEAAQKVGLAPIKVNMVVQRGVNESQILPMAAHFRGTGVSLRFIEYMDVGSSNGWQMDQVLPSQEVRERLHSVHPLQAAPSSQPGETAERFVYADGAGEVGFISSVTKAFCTDCNRARLSTEGQLYLCLFANQGHDLRQLLRGGASTQALSGAVAKIWQQRQDRYSEQRAQMPPSQGSERPGKVEMHYIGG